MISEMGQMRQWHSCKQVQLEMRLLVLATVYL